MATTSPGALLLFVNTNKPHAGAGTDVAYELVNSLLMPRNVYVFPDQMPASADSGYDELSTSRSMPIVVPATAAAAKAGASGDGGAAVRNPRQVPGPIGKPTQDMV
jgi:hypothetical protein